MTPLELLAVGVIVVLVWVLGWIAGATDGFDTPWYAKFPAIVGLGLAGWALVDLLILGIKEAAK